MTIRYFDATQTRLDHHHRVWSFNFIRQASPASPRHHWFCTGGVIAVPVAADVLVSLFCQKSLDEVASEASAVTGVAFCFSLQGQIQRDAAVGHSGSRGGKA
ncbi:hypothetical protein E4U13_006838 [Claviceps humidiphila]|uniref:Uncharacterized protein n=1 Tax=Claviceps humidiphila TaxID=1294629 RepID=A0A9P7U001_9HYPO|nr:hypothetical protein E4U13_006838 [Claviceps humidiphila]